MQLNNYELVDRYARPSVGSRVAIRTQFVNNGKYFDPYDISACTIFAKLANASPSSVLEPSSQIIKEGLSLGPTGVVMNFQISGGAAATDPHDGKSNRVTSQRVNNTTWFPNYTPAVNASGIYRVSSGDYVCVLDGEVDLSGGYNLNYEYQKGPTVANSASSVQEYIDVWTVKLFADSDYQVFINTFTLNGDGFITLTEPLIVNASNRLATKRVYIGSVEDLVVTTNLTVGNRNLSEDQKNIIQDAPIRKVEVDLKRILEGYAVPTSQSVNMDDVEIRITGDNSILIPFDSSSRSPGTYVLQVSYEFLAQKMTTQPMYFTVS